MATHPLGDEAATLVLAACDGDNALSELLGGTAASPSRQTTPQASPAVPEEGVFLKSISVEGFRGIGPEKTLTLQPGPGLTLVVGRNGSGKSSFAEALELLLTGTNQRWAKRTAAWRKDWQNLHHPSRTAIEAEFTVAGHGPTTVARRWPSGANVADGEATAQHKGEPRGAFSPLGWSAGLDLYRPFLSYNELGSILDEGPSKLFDAIATVLGVDELVAVADLLDAAGKRIADLEKGLKGEASRLGERLRAHDDPRADTALGALTRRGGADLDAIEALLSGADAGGTTDDLSDLRRLSLVSGPDLDAITSKADELRSKAAAVESVRGTDSDAARELASLLEAAIAHHGRHGAGDCPVCGNPAALDAAWRERSGAHVVELKAAAKSADDAHRALGNAINAAKALVSEPPAFLGDGDARVAWAAWAELGSSTLSPSALADELEVRAVALDAVLAAVRTEAAAELARREDLWRPLALELAAWLARAHQVRAATQVAKPLKVARDWVQEAAADARRERFAPIGEKARKIWDLLRQQSNVELRDIVLAGRSTSRRVDLDVTVDGVQGAALGVMSQGELHALALSLFLPRATMDASPFRFVVIDDPVQSMDPARVDGLARVLEEVATTHQVIVFTHDDRLREAVSRLQVAARVLEVTRRINSEVEIVTASNPVARALDDARALVRTRDLPENLAGYVVPTLCRQAIEARCADIVRRRRLERGETHVSVEHDLATADRLGARLALALFDDAQRGHVEIGDRLANKFGVRSREVFFRCNRGAHSYDDGDLDELVRDVAALVHALGGVS